jgi:hypothetical protein
MTRNYESKAFTGLVLAHLVESVRNPIENSGKTYKMQRLEHMYNRRKMSDSLGTGAVLYNALLVPPLVTRIASTTLYLFTASLIPSFKSNIISNSPKSNNGDNTRRHKAAQANYTPSGKRCMVTTRTTTT